MRREAGLISIEQVTHFAQMTLGIAFRYITDP